jgi:hypothetical protein
MSAAFWPFHHPHRPRHSGSIEQLAGVERRLWGAPVESGGDALANSLVRPSRAIAGGHGIFAGKDKDGTRGNVRLETKLTLAGQSAG